jgi:hypothetical protein
VLFLYVNLCYKGDIKMNEIRLPQPPIQKKINTNSTNYDIFSNTAIASELLSRYGLTSQKIANSSISMDITLLPDTACTVLWNGYEADAPYYFTTRGFVPISTLKIKETGISLLVSIQIP